MPIQILPPGEWRYFVVAFQGNNMGLTNLSLAWSLAQVEIDVGFTLIWLDGRQPDPGMIFEPNRLFHSLEAFKFGDGVFHHVTSAAVEEVRRLNSQIQFSAPQTKQLVGQLNTLKGLPHSSPLRFLGYFSLLESILTHAPKPEDRYDSITRQVKKKLQLLNNRWQPKLDYGPFSGATAEKVWGKMYEYRSAITHGGKPDFARELQILKSHDHALELLKETVKAVIRQVILEPTLIQDLREC